MSLIKKIGELAAAGILSLGLMACQTAKPLIENPKIILPPLTAAEKVEIKKESEEYRHMDLFPCTRNTVALVWNFDLPGERNGYYEIIPLYKNPSETPRLLRMKLIRIREDKNRNRMLDKKEEWIWEKDLKNKEYSEFIWQKEKNPENSGDYYTITRDENQDGKGDRKYSYAFRQGGMVHVFFDLKKIQWDRNHDNKFSKEEVVWDTK